MTTTRKFTAVALLLLAMTTAAVPAAATKDERAPTTTWTTKDGSVLVRLLHALEGSSRDEASPIARVVVRTSGPWVCATPGQGRTCYTVGNPLAWRSREALLSCNTARTSCSWRASLPDLPGEYLVQAYAVDAAGNEGIDCWFGFCFAPTIRVLVV